jgi:hypothetical protein
MNVRMLVIRGAKRGFVLLASALLISSVVVCALAGGKGNQNPGVLPPNSHSHGMSYGEWGDAWWQWALSIPSDVNPINDPTGADAAIGQTGQVWFLAGTSGGIANRTITVPAGQALFFPIVNQIWVNTPQLGDPEWSPDQEAYARELCAMVIDAVTCMHCEIDRKPVKNLDAYRCPTPVGEAFMVTVPEGNLFGVPADTYGPSVQDGIYLMLAPLSAGHHTIHLTAKVGPTSPFGAFSLDVTYHITVKGGRK